MIRGSIQSRGKIFLFSKCLQFVPEVIFPGVKLLGGEVDYTPPSSAKVKHEWSYTSAPLQCLCGVQTQVSIPHEDEEGAAINYGD
jgi:hypothetical protein